MFSNLFHEGALPLENRISLVTPNQLEKTIQSLGSEFQITFELLFNCFEEPRNSLNLFNILSFTKADGTFFSLDFLPNENLLQLKFNGVATKQSPAGIFTTKTWYQYVIKQEKRDSKVTIYHTHVYIPSSIGLICSMYFLCPLMEDNFMKKIKTILRPSQMLRCLLEREQMLPMHWSRTLKWSAKILSLKIVSRQGLLRV